MVAWEAPSEKCTGANSEPVVSWIWARAKCSPVCSPVVLAVMDFGFALAASRSSFSVLYGLSGWTAMTAGSMTCRPRGWKLARVYLAPRAGSNGETTTDGEPVAPMVYPSGLALVSAV